MLNSNQVTVNPISAVLFMLKAVALSYIISFVMLFAAALLATFQSFSDTAVYILANLVTALGTAIAGFTAGRHFDSKGIFFGAGCGIIYTLILCIIGNIVSSSIHTASSFLIALAIGVICGAVGGIAGINTKKTRRR